MSRVLVVDLDLPQSTRDGGARRMLEILRLLSELGQDVSFVSTRLWDPELEVSLGRLADLGVCLGPSGDELRPFLAAEARTFDTVVLSRLDVADGLVSFLRDAAPRARLVYDAVHVEHLARYRLAKLSGNRPLLVAALADRERERRVVEQVDAVLVTSEEDAEEVRRLVPTSRPRVVPAVLWDPDPVSSDSRCGIVFLGFLGMPENELAARRLVDDVWPLVEEEAGETPLTILGATPPDWLRARRQPRLTVPGFLADVDAPLRRAAVLVSPLSGGSGVKSKVLHAFARRLPVVATSDGLRGVPAQDGVHVLREESNDALAKATARLLADPSLGRGLADRSAELLRTRFGAETSRAGLRAVLDA